MCMYNVHDQYNIADEIGIYYKKWYSDKIIFEEMLNNWNKKEMKKQVRSIEKANLKDLYR